MNKLLFSLLLSLVSSFSAFSGNYYWVGGSGNWSDINHWRTTSGGSVTPNVVPGPTDDVYFDSNSGFTNSSKSLVVNVVANCRNLTVSGTNFPPALTSVSSGSINIYGSSVWERGMTFTSPIYGRDVDINYQNTGIPKTITSNGVIFNRFKFYETSSVSLLDDFSANEIWIQAGTWNTNNFRIDCNNFKADDGVLYRTINLGSSEIYMIVRGANRGGGYFTAFSTRTILNGGASHIFFPKECSRMYLSAYKDQVFNNVTFENPDIEAEMAGNTLGGVIFNRVEFKSSAIIRNNNIFNELVFSPAKKYTLTNGTTQTINSLLSAAGSLCSDLMWIESSIPGSYATISMPASASVEVEGVYMKDIRAIGGAKFIANGSFNDGGNSGWTFTNSNGNTNNLYWVGGAGNWNDVSHWSTTSGGIGGACLPSPTNNVFFDANSGFTASSKIVKIDLTSYCRDITFSGSEIPPFVQSEERGVGLNIYGSSVWQRDMEMKAYLNYQNTGIPKTITSNGVATADLKDSNLSDESGSVHFYETSSISLLDDFSVRALYTHAGTWNTNSFKVDVVQSITATQGTFNLGSSDIYVGTSLNFDGANKTFTLNAGTSHFYIRRGFINNNNFFNHVFYNVTFEDDDPLYTASIKSDIRYRLIFNRLEFKVAGRIENDNIFNELVMGSGYTYSFAFNSTQTINKHFSVGRSCSNWTTMKSLGSAIATISMPAGATVEVTDILMNNIKATGGASFIAANSVDNGGNEGWTFTVREGVDLYWVGGSGNWNDVSHWSATSGGIGGACIPSPTDNVFFDANSGFTTNSKTVTIDLNSYCRDITFSGSEVPPLLKPSTSSGIYLDIYGSSVWQRDMTISLTQINYRDTGTPKTITSNGVKSLASTVTIYETSSMTLLDDFGAGSLSLQGTFNSKDFRIDITKKFSASGTVDLGSSNIYLSHRDAAIVISSLSMKFNAGTSHFHFTGETTSSNYNGVDSGTSGNIVFYNLSFENPNSVADFFGNGTFNRVELKGTGTFKGSNTFNELNLLSTTSYTFGSGTTQIIKNNLVMSGTPCDVLSIKSSVVGTQANLEVLAGNTTFNFVNLQDINASGLPLHFGAQSTIAEQNNSNVTFDPYDPGALNGFGPDWLCRAFDDNDPASYTLSASGFFGNEYSQYSWTKINDPDYKGVIGTTSSIDLREFGYGTYKVEVTYTNGTSIMCKVSDQILVTPSTPSIQVNDPFEVCIKGDTKLSDISIVGQDIKWYATESSLAVLDIDTVLEDGATYYVTQTMDSCESPRTAVTVNLINCSKAIYINPNLRQKVRH